VSRVLRAAQQGHFGDESFQAVSCTGTDNSKQTRENKPKKDKKNHKKNKRILGKKNM